MSGSAEKSPDAPTCDSCGDRPATLSVSATVTTRLCEPCAKRVEVEKEVSVVECEQCGTRPATVYRGRLFPHRVCVECAESALKHIARKCESCHSRPITVHVTEIVEGKKQERHLCEECAAKLAPFAHEPEGCELCGKIPAGFYQMRKDYHFCDECRKSGRFVVRRKTVTR